MQNMIDSVSKYKNTFLVGQVASRWVLSPRKSDFWGTSEISGTADTPTGAEREMNGMASLIHGCVPVGESISNLHLADLEIMEEMILNLTLFQLWLFQNCTKRKDRHRQWRAWHSCARNFQSFQFVGNSQELFKVFKYPQRNTKVLTQAREFHLIGIQC